jgi:hypothetical protein
MTGTFDSEIGTRVIRIPVHMHQKSRQGSKTVRDFTAAMRRNPLFTSPKAFRRDLARAAKPNLRPLD